LSTGDRVQSYINGLFAAEDSVLAADLSCGRHGPNTRKQIYHAGDTALTLEMQLLKGKVDIMLVPIGDNFTMGIKDAAKAVEFVRPQVAIPMHWDTFDVIAANPEDFVSAVGSAATVRVLQPGEAYAF